MALPTTVHFLYRLIMSCRTLGNIPGIPRMIQDRLQFVNGLGMIPAATCIRATRPCCFSTGVLYIRVFMYPQKWKSNGVRSGERGGQATEPTSPIHLLPKVSFKWGQQDLVAHTSSRALVIRDMPGMLVAAILSTFCK